MLNKNDILDSLLTEIEIVRHLATKVPDNGLEYRPTEGQRNTLETLRYLSFCGIGGTLAMVDGDWDGYRKWAEAAETLTAEEFPAALDRQADALQLAFAKLSDEDFATRKAKHPMGHEMSLRSSLLEVPLKWMVGYRMQLFLYCKAAGNSEIGTANCWVGIDLPKAAK
jgi:hypothetical protein